MPQVRKLAPEEVQAIENKGKGQRKLTEELYDAFLSEYEVGDYGEAELDPDEKRLTVRNRLRAAASRRDVGLHSSASMAIPSAFGLWLLVAMVQAHPRECQRLFPLRRRHLKSVKVEGLESRRRPGRLPVGVCSSRLTRRLELYNILCIICSSPVSLTYAATPDVCAPPRSIAFLTVPILRAHQPPPRWPAVRTEHDDTAAGSLFWALGSSPNGSPDHHAMITSPVDLVDGVGVQALHNVGRAHGRLRAGVACGRLHHRQARPPRSASVMHAWRRLCGQSADGRAAAAKRARLAASGGPARS
jgi:hypothetical protein